MENLLDPINYDAVRQDVMGIDYRLKKHCDKIQHFILRYYCQHNHHDMEAHIILFLNPSYSMIRKNIELHGLFEYVPYVVHLVLYIYDKGI